MIQGRHSRGDGKVGLKREHDLSLRDHPNQLWIDDYLCPYRMTLN